MRNFHLLLISIFILSCSTNRPQKQKEEFTQENNHKVIKAIDSGTFSSFQDAISDKDFQGSAELHNYLAEICSSRSQRVTEQMALSLIEKGILPSEKIPLKKSLENGCAPLLSVYLENMSPEEIAQVSLGLESTDFVTFTERIVSEEIETKELISMEERPFAVDLAIQKNSELCLEKEENCRARDHLIDELKEMKDAVARFSYYKACSLQIELVNTLQLMNEQIDFAKVTGVASPQTYDTHAIHAQELRGWHQYYQNLFFKTTGETADLNQCFL